MEMTLAERLKAAMSAAGLNQVTLAEKVGVSQAAIQKLTSGKAKSSNYLLSIARELGVSPDWLSSGLGDMHNVQTARDDGTIKDYIKNGSEFYRVDVLDVQASAGYGTLVSTDFVERIRAIEYTNEQARTMFGNRPAESVKVITVRGDSMEGTINPGDEIFVDMGVTHFDGDGVYVFVFGKTLHVKRLQMQRTRLAVLSDNPAYKEWFIEDGDEDQFYIMAKVLMRQSIDYKRFG